MQHMGGKVEFNSILLAIRKIIIIIVIIMMYYSFWIVYC